MEESRRDLRRGKRIRYRFPTMEPLSFIQRRTIVSKSWASRSWNAGRRRSWREWRSRPRSRRIELGASVFEKPSAERPAKRLNEIRFEYGWSHARQETVEHIRQLRRHVEIRQRDDRLESFPYATVDDSLDDHIYIYIYIYISMHVGTYLLKSVPRISLSAFQPLSHFARSRDSSDRRRRPCHSAISSPGTRTGDR